MFCLSVQLSHLFSFRAWCPWQETGLVQLDSLQAELVAKKCTTDFRHSAAPPCVAGSESMSTPTLTEGWLVVHSASLKSCWCCVLASGFGWNPMPPRWQMVPPPPFGAANWKMDDKTWTWVCLVRNLTRNRSSWGMLQSHWGPVACRTSRIQVR